MHCKGRSWRAGFGYCQVYEAILFCCWFSKHLLSFFFLVLFRLTLLSNVHDGPEVLGFAIVRYVRPSFPTVYALGNVSPSISLSIFMY